MILIKGLNEVPKSCKECPFTRGAGNCDICFEGRNHPAIEFYSAYEAGRKPAWCPCKSLDEVFGSIKLRIGNISKSFIYVKSESKQDDMKRILKSELLEIEHEDHENVGE